MRTMLWAVAVLALEVLLLSGYFAVVGEGQIVSRNVALALLAGTVSVVVWLGFKNGFEQTRPWRRRGQRRGRLTPLFTERRSKGILRR
jgi:hypothetical protein